NQSLSPDVYARLLKSRVVLQTIARDTFQVQEIGGKRMTFYDLFNIHDESPIRREDKGVKVLSNVVTVGVAKLTGVVEIAVATKWRSVSLGIADQLINGVNDYNERTRQTQASAERKFVEGRLTVAGADLREAED